MCTFGVRSKDAGAYDLGELDQALFLYLDGQDPSTVNQDQRREPSLSLPLSLSPSLSHFLQYSFSFPLFCFCWEDSLWKGLFEGHRENMFSSRLQICLSANSTFFDQILCLAAARKIFFFSNFKKKMFSLIIFPSLFEFIFVACCLKH
jgi:hypothetical protein